MTATTKTFHIRHTAPQVFSCLEAFKIFAKSAGCAITRIQTPNLDTVATVTAVFDSPLTDRYGSPDEASFSLYIKMPNNATPVLVAHIRHFGTTEEAWNDILPTWFPEIGETCQVGETHYFGE